MPPATFVLCLHLHHTTTTLFCHACDFGKVCPLPVICRPCDSIVYFLHLLCPSLYIELLLVIWVNCDSVEALCCRLCLPAVLTLYSRPCYLTGWWACALVGEVFPVRPPLLPAWDRTFIVWVPAIAQTCHTHTCTCIHAIIIIYAFPYLTSYAFPFLPSLFTLFIIIIIYCTFTCNTCLYM